MVVIRCPVHGNIRVEGLPLALMDTGVVQRLRYVRQLGLAHLVYPGATHSRFEHALGALHLARTALRILREAGQLALVPEHEPALVEAAALLHDVGHYPFSHALEEIGVPHHETVAGPLLAEGEVGALLRGALGSDAPARVLSLVRGEGALALGGLISGAIDLDKIDYLRRDALACGVPYGEIDVDRLLHNLAVVADPDSGRPVVALRDKGLSALESLLFAKYQMYRNVYWHHAVRGATAMYKRLVDDALRAGALDAVGLAGHTDEGLLHVLGTHAPGALLDAIRGRRLHKRAFEVPAAELDGLDLDWLAEDRDRARRAEDALGAALGLAPGELLLDFPKKERMLGLDLPVLDRAGRVSRLTDAGRVGAVNLPRLADEFYKTARWLRVFTARRLDLPRATVLDALA